ncbi:MAG: GntR family transcriptional regulator [Eubacterium sp.]|nr:GntR family transcriptional regulator [Eubacterium sp.]
MYISIDFNSDEALYLQLRNQIILAIVKAELQEGENLPSVRDMAETVGINMHTVNKAYAMLRQEGYLRLDRRHGAVVAVDMDQVKATMELAETLDLILAQAICKNVSRSDVHDLVDQIYNQYEGFRNGE